MSGILVASAFAASLVAVLLSTVSVMIHYARRGDNPVLGPIEQQIQALQLGQADVIDRIDHWTRRDRTRRMREGAQEQPEESKDPVVIKQRLREIARVKGVIR